MCVPVDGLRRRDARHAAFSQQELGASVGWKPEAMKRLVREGRPAALLESSHATRGTWTLQLFARGATHQCIATFTGTVAEYDRLRSAVAASMETMR